MAAPIALTAGSANAAVSYDATNFGVITAPAGDACGHPSGRH